MGKVAYRLELPKDLRHIHDIFHVPQLRKHIADEVAMVPMEDIQIDDRLNYVEKPMAIMDRKVKTWRNKLLNLFKVQGQHGKGSEGRWELETKIREHYPELFLEDDFEGKV